MTSYLQDWTAPLDNIAAPSWMASSSPAGNQEAPSQQAQVCLSSCTQTNVADARTGSLQDGCIPCCTLSSPTESHGFVRCLYQCMLQSNCIAPSRFSLGTLSCRAIPSAVAVRVCPLQLTAKDVHSLNSFDETDGTFVWIYHEAV